MDSFLKKISEVLHDLIVPGEKVLVGVSGGADSIALLYALHHFSGIRKFSLFVAHINHMARGQDSYDDACFVKGVADKLSLPFFLKEIDVEKERCKIKTSFQDAARIIRYQYFEEILNSLGGHKIALGHSADDQIETILMNLLRGSGLKGLAGISQVRGNIIRPFLKIYRKELEKFLVKKGISFRHDSSNLSQKYLRNRVRHDLVPYLENYNPGIRRGLQEMSEIAREDDALLSKMTRDIFIQKSRFQDENEKILVWDVNDFQSYPVALRKRLIREIYYRITGNMLEITAQHVQQIIHLFNEPKSGKGLNIPGRVTVTCSYRSIVFERLNEKTKGKLKDSQQDSTQIIIPGFTELPLGQMQVETRIYDQKKDFPALDPSRQAYLDLGKTGLTVKARFFRPGDRFCPLGMSGSKKLKSFFIDRKVPRNLRFQIPILTNAVDDIIWVYGQRISHCYRVTDNTKKILFVQGNKTINY